MSETPPMVSVVLIAVSYSALDVCRTANVSPLVAVPADEVIAAARAVVGMRHVVLSFEADRQRSGATRDPERRAASLAGPEQPILDRPSSGRAPTVRFARPGVELNLGAIGKGHAVARIAARLRAQSIGPALVSAADSSIEAVGAPAGGWLIALREDRAQYGDGHAMSVEARGSTPHARIRLRRGALATSGSGEQGFVHDGVRYGHLVDPRTGWPVGGVARVTVGADAAADADALATAFLIGGPALARRYVEAHPRTVAIMTVSDDPRPLIIGHHPGMRVEVECS